MSDPTPNIEPRPRYTWPWFVGAAVLLGVVIAVFAVKREVDRVRLRNQLLQQHAPAAPPQP